MWPSLTWKYEKMHCYVKEHVTEAASTLLRNGAIQEMSTRRHHHIENQMHTLQNVKDRNNNPNITHKITAENHTENASDTAKKIQPHLLRIVPAKENHMGKRKEKQLPESNTQKVRKSGHSHKYTGLP